MQAPLIDETKGPDRGGSANLEVVPRREPPQVAAPAGELPRAERARSRVRSPGLQARILLLMVASLSVLALVSAFATSAVLQGRMLQDARSKGEAIAQGLALAAAPLSAPAAETTAAALLEAFEEIEGVAYLVLYDRRGTPVASTYGSDLPEVLSRPPELLPDGASSALMVPRQGERRLVTAMDIASSGPFGVVRVGMDRDQILAQVRRINVDLMVIQGIVALVALLSAILFSARLVRPIRALVKLARAVGRGDLSHTVRITSRDEVGLLTRTFNDTVRRLRGLVVTEAERDEERRRRESLQTNIRSFLQVTQQIAQGDLRGRGRVTADVLGNVVDSINLMVGEIGDTLHGVREAAGGVSTSADEMIHTTERIGASVETQLGTAKQVSKSVLDVSASVREVSNTAEASSETARQTQAAAQTGQEAVRETLDSMERIRGEVQGISRRIKALGDRSLEISEIVDTISGISAQTNLLALNAAIEASGAGEYGARFAVVADEVRNLAEEAARSSQNISRLIKAVQLESNEAVGAMEAGTDEVPTGFLLARQAGERLEDIARISQRSAAMAERISTETTGQVDSMEQVARSVTEIAELAQNTDQTVTSGRETVNKVRHLAQQLMDRLAGFQLPETT